METIEKEELTKVGERILFPYFWWGKESITITIFKDRDGKVWEKLPDSFGNVLFGGRFIENQYDDTGWLDGVAANGYARMV